MSNELSVQYEKSSDIIVILMHHMITEFWYLSSDTFLCQYNFSHKGTNPIQTACFITTSYNISGSSWIRCIQILGITLVAKEVWMTKQAS